MKKLWRKSIFFHIACRPKRKFVFKQNIITICIVKKVRKPTLVTVTCLSAPFASTLQAFTPHNAIMYSIFITGERSYGIDVISCSESQLCNVSWTIYLIKNIFFHFSKTGFLKIIKSWSKMKMEWHLLLRVNKLNI